MKATERFYKVYDNILSDERLSYPEKILYGVIVRLASNGESRCFASNKALAEIMGSSKSSVSKWLETLVKTGYIQRSFHYANGTKCVDRRYIKPMCSAGLQEGGPQNYKGVFRGFTRGCSADLQEGIPPDYKDSKINIVKENSKSEGSKKASPKSNNFFLNLVADGNGDDIF